MSKVPLEATLETGILTDGARWATLETNIRLFTEHQTGKNTRSQCTLSFSRIANSTPISTCTEFSTVT